MIEKTKKVPGYAATIKDTNVYNLMHRAYIPWYQKCKTDFHELIDKRADAMATMAGVQGILTFIIVLCGFANGVVLSVMETYNMCGKDVPCIDGSGKEEAKKIRRYKKRIAHISKLLQIPFSLIMLIVINSNESFFHQMSGKGCSDEHTEDMFVFFSDKIKEVKSKNITFLVMLIIMWIIDLLKICFNKWKKSKKRAKKKAAALAKTGGGKPVKKGGKVHPAPQSKTPAKPTHQPPQPTDGGQQQQYNYQPKLAGDMIQPQGHPQQPPPGTGQQQQQYQP